MKATTMKKQPLMRLKSVHHLPDGTQRKWLKLMTRDKVKALPQELSKKYKCDVVTVEGPGGVMLIRVYHSAGSVDTISATPLK